MRGSKLIGRQLEILRKAIPLTDFDNEFEGRTLVEKGGRKLTLRNLDDAQDFID